jgi:hypothetical protein
MNPLFLDPPDLSLATFIAPDAQVIGAVHLEEGVSIWYGAVLRGDVERIIVGHSTNIQDGAVVHGDPGIPTVLGNYVTVGHRAIIHSATVEDEEGPKVHFNSNELLETLGYTRSNSGCFPSNIRAQLNRDLVALHRTELVFPKAQKMDKEAKPEYTDFVVKKLLTIEEFRVSNGPRQNFDWDKAADYTSELADAYTISLGFFEGLGRTGDYVLFADSIDLRQRNNSNTKYDYRMKLLIYLASRMRWDSLQDGQYLVISKQYLLKNLDLLGKNASRNNAIFWETVEELKNEGYVLEAQELPGKKKGQKIRFQINPEMLRCHQ